MSAIGSILGTLPLANRGVGAADKLKVFLVIAFETTAFANKGRRARIKRILQKLSDENGLLTIHFGRDGERFVFKLRALEDGDISVASEFIRAGYQFPQGKPAQIIDGGANIGLFSILASKRFPDVRIECFEANPANIEALQRNIDANGANAQVLNKALWSGPSELTFHSHMTYSGTVSDKDDGSTDGVRVPADLPEIGEDCWMKVDIEGAEYEVLPAVFKSGKLPRWISAELHHFLEKGAPLIAQMEQHGYTVTGLPQTPTSDMVEIFAERK